MAALANLFVSFGIDTSAFHAGVQGISKDVSAMDKAFKPIKDRAKDIGNVLTAGLTVPLVGLGTAAVASALKLDDAMDAIRAGTGATGAAFDQLGVDFKSVLGTVPNAIGEVATAITDLSQRTGLTGKSLQDLATQELNLARITKTDVGEAIASTTRVFGNWQITTDDQSAALDFLFKVSQNTGVSVSRLSETITKFGGPLREMGFDFQTSAALIGQFEKAGVNAEGVLNGLNLALRNMAKAGITDSAQALELITGQIKDAGSASEANAISIKVFGKSGIVMAEAIRSGRLSVDDLLKTLRESPETINGAAKATLSFADKLAMLKEQATKALSPIGERLLDALEKLMPTIERVLGFVADLANAFANLSPNAQLAVIGALGFAAALGPIILVGVKIASTVTGLIGLFQGFGGAALKLSGPLMAGIKSLTSFGGIAAALASPLGIAVIAITAVATVAYLVYRNWDVVGPKLMGIWNALKEGAAKIWNAIQDGIATFTSAANEIWKKYGADILAVWDGVKSGLAAAWSRISDLAIAGIQIVSSVISNGLKFVVGVAEVALGLLTGNWRTAWDGIKNMTFAVVNVIKDIGQSLFRFVLTDIQRMLDGLAAAAASLGAKLPGFLGAPARAAATALQSASGAVGGYVAAMGKGTQVSAEFGKATGDVFHPLNEQKLSVGGAASVWGEYFAKQEKATASTINAGAAMKITGLDAAALAKMLSGTKDKHSESEKAAKAQAEALKHLKEQFTDSLKPADALSIEFAKLSKMGFTTAQIVAVYGDQILKATGTQRQHGIAISGITQQLEPYALGLLHVKDASENLKKSQDEMKKTLENSGVELRTDRCL